MVCPNAMPISKENKDLVFGAQASEGLWMKVFRVQGLRLGAQGLCWAPYTIMQLKPSNTGLLLVGKERTDP